MDLSHLVRAMGVPSELTDRCGILSVTGLRGSLVFADSFVEKPALSGSPLLLAVVGRYILDPTISVALACQALGAGGGVQLIASIAGDRGNHGHCRFLGRLFDCCSKQGILVETLFLALNDLVGANVVAKYLTQ